MICCLPPGEVDPALASACHTIRGGSFTIGSQQHFYMEPQVAVATPDEGGALVVYSSTQGLDNIQEAVCRVLGLPANQVVVKCRRAGGAFGGKVSVWVFVLVLVVALSSCTSTPVNFRSHYFTLMPATVLLHCVAGEL